jgi:hypothetical protein
MYCYCWWWCGVRRIILRKSKYNRKRATKVQCTLQALEDVCPMLLYLAGLSWPFQSLLGHQDEDRFKASVCRCIYQWEGGLCVSVWQHINLSYGSLVWYRSCQPNDHGIRVPLRSTRVLYIAILKNETTAFTPYLQAIFASQYYGESRACSMLFIEYQKALLDVATSKFHNTKTKSAMRELFDNASFKTESTQQFQHWFDMYCKHAFLNCMHNYNDYSQPLILAENFMNYLNLS